MESRVSLFFVRVNRKLVSLPVPRVLVSVVLLLATLVSSASSLAQIVGSGNLNIERRGHTATLLPDGKVVIVGGENQTGPVRQAEIFDPASQTSTPAAMAFSARTDHTATALADGRVLIIGGRSESGQLDSTELFDPYISSFSAGPSLIHARSGHTATVLADGRILVAGGNSSGSAELYNPATDRFSLVTGSLRAVRQFHSAIRLQSGKVLIVGGVNGPDVLNTAEIFDPETQGFSPIASTLQTARGLSLLRLLPDGKVQVIGGDSELSMEVYDPQDGLFNGLALLPPNVSLLEATLSTHSRAALMSPAISQDFLLQGVLTPDQSMLLDRSDQSITELPQLNQALVAGGLKSTGQVLSSAMLVKSSPATITTDKTDYAPGEIVTITSTGWKPGEQVDIFFHEFPDEYPDIFQSASADQQGKFITAEFAPQLIDIDRNFTLTAVGQVSGFVAQTVFKDAVGFQSVSVGAQSPNPVVAGNQATYTITLDFNGSGNTGCSATLNVTTGLPTGASASFNPNPVSSDGADQNSTLTVTTNALTTPPGNYTFTVQGVAPNVSGGQGCNGATRMATGTLVVSAATFSVTFDASPISDVAAATAILTVTIGAGAATSVTKGELPKIFSNLASGTNISYSYHSPLAASASKQYRWHSTGGTGSASSQTTQSGSFNITSTSTVTAAYVAQWQQTFTHSGLASDATGTVATVDGAAKGFSDLAFTKFVDQGATVAYSYNDPVTSSTTGKRYRRDSVTGPASGYTVAGANTITGNYIAQYQLTLAITSGVPGGLGNISGGVDGTYYDAGTVLNLSATTPVADGVGKQWRFNNWTGDVPSSPNSNSLVSITMNQARSVTANYVVQFQLTLAITSGVPGGLGNISGGVDGTFYDSGTVLNLSATTPVADGVGKRWRFNNWTGDVPSSPNSNSLVSITMNQARSVTANYVAQYLLTISMNPAAVSRGNVIPADGWFDTGTAISLNATSPVSGGPALGYVFKNWTGDIPSSPNTANPLGVTMNQARTVQANYTTWTLEWASNSAFSGQYSDPTGLKALLKADGAPVAGKTINFYVGSNSGSGVTAINGVAGDSAVLTQDPAPPYTATATCLAAQCGVLLTITNAYDITKEDAVANYTGTTFAWSASTTDGKATVLLNATVQDITAVTGDPAYDPYAGDISKATVTFKIVETGQQFTAPVVLVNGVDTKVGIAATNAVLDIGSGDSVPFTVNVFVNGYYTCGTNVACDSTTLTVSKPLNTNFITGGGYIMLSSSAGVIAGDAGRKNNFGFNVKYGKGGKNLKGNVNIIVRKTVDGVLRTYQIKSTAIDSLGVNPSPCLDATSTAPCYAQFNSKANIQDVTNPEGPVSIVGGAILRMTMTDNGETGSDKGDSIGITVIDSKTGQLWYSSNWVTASPPQTVELELGASPGGGNLKVR